MSNSEGWNVTVKFESGVTYSTYRANLFDVPSLITEAREVYFGEGDVVEIRFFD